MTTEWGRLFLFFAAAGLALLGVFDLVWRATERRQNANLVDAVWSWSFAGLAAFYALIRSSPWSFGVALLAAIWSLRLGGHLFLTRAGEPVEDGRYRALRNEWGADAPRRMRRFFRIQAVSALLLSLPLLAAIARPAPPPFGSIRFAAGALVWLLAVAGEAAADGQLARFRARPGTRGKTCREGLWRYSRHPNYFFEWLHWWTYPILALGAPWPFVAPALLGPVLMGLVLLKFTGLPATEAHARISRADYADYQRTTSAFIPWFPRKGTEP